MRKTTMEKIDMHKLLVNGICGAKMNHERENDLQQEYLKRGLARYEGPGDRYYFAWDRDALDAQPNHVLVGIYERVSA